MTVSLLKSSLKILESQKVLFILDLFNVVYAGFQASLAAQLVKIPPVMQETWVRSLGWEDPLEKGKATHSSILAWKIPWTIQLDMTERVLLSLSCRLSTGFCVTSSKPLLSMIFCGISWHLWLLLQWNQRKKRMRKIKQTKKMQNKWARVLVFYLSIFL